MMNVQWIKKKKNYWKNQYTDQEPSHAWSVMYEHKSAATQYFNALRVFFILIVACSVFSSFCREQ